LKPARKAARLASRIGGFDSNFFSIQAMVESVGRPYIQETRPRAKKFFDRAASREVISMPSVARIVIEVIGTRKTWYPSSESSSSGFES
jgi:hypothetical protein